MTALAWLIVVAIPLPGAASGALPIEECDTTPVRVAEIGPFAGDVRFPMVLGDHVWFAGTIYTADGRPVGATPVDSIHPGASEFGSAIGSVPYGSITWGALAASRADGMPGGSIYRPDGSKVIDIDADGAAGAVYVDDQHILVSEGYRRGPGDEVRVFIVNRSGRVVELDVDTREETERFGTVTSGGAFVLHAAGGVGRYGLDGSRLGDLPEVAGRPVDGVFAAHGYVYTVETGRPSGNGALSVFDPGGRHVATLRLDGPIGDVGATRYGIAATVLLPDPQDEGGYIRHVELWQPSGRHVATLSNGENRDTDLFTSHGPYVMLHTPTPGSSLGSRYGTVYELFLEEGTSLGSLPPIETATGPGIPAGRVLVGAGPDPDRPSVQFHDLTGALIARDALELTAPYGWVEEATGTDHRHVWAFTGQGDGQSFAEHTAIVYDLGPCGGVPDGGPFADDDTTVFSDDIGWLASAAITRGCDPPANTRFCPGDPVTRGQMAAFLVRALGIPPGEGDGFVDAAGSGFEDEIHRLAAAGVTRGCNPPEDDRFCPGDPVTRGQMAAFLTRALHLPATGADPFRDDDSSVFEAEVGRLDAAGITRGCNPPVNDRFCPDDSVTRGEMAAFLHRALHWTEPRTGRG